MGLVAWSPQYISLSPLEHCSFPPAEINTLQSYQIVSVYALYTLKLSASHRESKHSTSNSFNPHSHTNETIRLTLNLRVPFVQNTLIIIDEQEEIHYWLGQ